MPFQMIKREDWGAMEVEYEHEELPSPIFVIQIVSNTDAETCMTRGDCGETVQEMQRVHIQEDKLQDINYNFLIGGDGNVYEGRGWHKKVQKLNNWQADISNNLVLGFIGGDVVANPPSHSVIHAFQEFIAHYTEEGKLSDGIKPVQIKM